VCVSFNYFALVLSLCCSTGVRCGTLGSESTMDTVDMVYGNRINCGILLEEFCVVCDEDRIDYLVGFYSKSK
jgi:hypothetical protein